ncbi:MAG TPA: hypothetical protein VLA98_08510 [Solirubrobacteraceae bacterium]|nr:hypothetical protein [Solirubrobacteraceae bacterium]
MRHHNALQWDGGPGHYEVWYLSATDRGSGLGLWIRFTLRAPSDGSPAECALWFLAMDRERRVARKATLPIAELHAERDPFALTIGGADLTDRGMAGAFDDVAWELTWEPTQPPAEHVHPLLRRARVAKTVLVLPHPDLRVAGTVRIGGETLTLDGARGGQAHLWGFKHAARWAWMHCNDLQTAEGEPRDGDWLDGVSVFVPRAGREVGPSTPVVGRLLGEPFRSVSPARVLRNASAFGLTSWRVEARDGARRVACEVDAPRESLVGVTYHDPDGDEVLCFNSEVATLRATVFDRTSRGRFGWVRRATLLSRGRAHFEYAQRAPVAGVEVLLR